MELPLEGEQVIDSMLLMVNIGKRLAFIHMEIEGKCLTNMIVDGGSRVNILSKEAWKCLGKPTLWP